MVSYAPVLWNEYFNIRDDIELDVGTFRIYRRGVEGPLLFFLHGGGFSALTWSVLSVSITEQVKCQCLAVDMRGHGDTKCLDDGNLSVDTLARDVIKIIFAMYPTEAPPIILVGHSMGGAVAVHVACKRTIPSLAGLVVIDVVEGSALSSLQGMTTFLNSRPRSFCSLSSAIEWSVRTAQIRNLNSARVSFPGQLKRIGTDQTATSELDQGFALISNTGHSTIKPAINSRCAGQLPPEPIVEDPNETIECGLIDDHKPEIPSVLDQSAGGVIQLNHNSAILPSDQSDLIIARSLPPVCSSTKLNVSNLHVSNSEVSQARNQAASLYASKRTDSVYTWRIDLIKTQPFWQEWFSGLSKLFLSIPEPKLLLLADVDRMDKDLTIGQMQGKFQLHVFPRTGHAVHEDAPEKVAECLARFLVRHRFTKARSNFEK